MRCNGTYIYIYIPQLVCTTAMSKSNMLVLYIPSFCVVLFRLHARACLPSHITFSLSRATNSHTLCFLSQAPPLPTDSIDCAPLLLARFRAHCFPATLLLTLLLPVCVCVAVSVCVCASVCLFLSLPHSPYNQYDLKCIAVRCSVANMYVPLGRECTAIHAHINACLHAHKCACVCSSLSVYVLLHIYVDASMYVCVCVCVYAYKCMDAGRWVC